MDWAFILVIILSVFLALFLLLGIVLIILLIRVTMQIREVTKSAQNTATTVEKMVLGVSKISSPAILARLLVKQAKRLRKRKEKEEKEK